jgi:hypothetical protein
MNCKTITYINRVRKEALKESGHKLVFITNSRNGVSSYIAVLLLMILAVSAGVVIYSVSVGNIGRLDSDSLDFFGAILLESVTCDAENLTAYIRNTGKRAVRIDRAYVDDAPVIGPGYLLEVNGPDSGDDEIREGKLGTVVIQIPTGYDPGRRYTFKIFSSDNTQIEFTIKVTHFVPTSPGSVEELLYVDVDTSNVDLQNDLGMLLNFINVKSEPDGSYASLMESLYQSANLYDPVDNNTSDVDGSPGKGTHSNFDYAKSVDGLYDNMTEEFTGSPESGFKVYHDSFEFASGTSTVQNIGDAVDTNHSFLVVYTAGTGSPREPDEGSCYGYISSPTQITFERQTSSSGLYVSWFVVECLDEEFTVRGRGTIELPSGIQNNSSAISGVQDVDQCTVMYGGHKGEGGSSNDWEDAFCNVHLVDNVTVMAKRHSGSTGTKTTVAYEVVEWSSNYSIHTGEVLVDSSSVTDLISGGGNPDDPVIDVSRSMVLANWWAEQNGIQQVQVYYSITDANELTFGQYSGGRDPLVRWYVVEFPATAAPNIQRFSYNWNPGSAPNNVRSNSISQVDPNRTFIRMSCSVSGTLTAFRRDYSLPRLDSAISWSETQYNPTGGSQDQLETRASVIELPYTSPYVSYELDLEVNFTSVDESYDETILCVRTGSMDLENLSLSVWNVTAGSWDSLTLGLEYNWNNFTINDYVSPEVTLRFLGGNESSDSIQDSWQIDACLLRQYNETFLLDQEMQWLQCNSSRSNAEVCIYTGSMDPEDLCVDVWNKTSASWVNVFSDMVADSWNNATVKDLLVDDNEVTIRFSDTVMAGDANQDVWMLDTVALHSWD